MVGAAHAQTGSRCGVSGCVLACCPLRRAPCCSVSQVSWHGKPPSGRCQEDAACARAGASGRAAWRTGSSPVWEPARCGCGCAQGSRRGPLHHRATDGPDGHRGPHPRPAPGAHHHRQPGRGHGRSTWRTDASRPGARISSGSPTSPTAQPGPGWSTSRSSSTSSSAASEDERRAVSIDLLGKIDLPGIMWEPSASC